MWLIACLHAFCYNNNRYEHEFTLTVVFVSCLILLQKCVHHYVPDGNGDELVVTYQYGGMGAVFALFMLFHWNYSQSQLHVENKGIKTFCAFKLSPGFKFLSIYDNKL